MSVRILNFIAIRVVKFRIPPVKPAHNCKTFRNRTSSQDPLNFPVVAADMHPLNHILPLAPGPGPFLLAQKTIALLAKIKLTYP